LKVGIAWTPLSFIAGISLSFVADIKPIGIAEPVSQSLIERLIDTLLLPATIVDSMVTLSGVRVMSRGKLDVGNPSVGRKERLVEEAKDPVVTMTRRITSR
jgi:hypothetical protein